MAKWGILKSAKWAKLLFPFYRKYIKNFDADAAAFITAAGITNSTQKTAINQLVLDLKTAGIWTKMIAIYPFVGGSASSHKWNLKDARDLDAAFRLIFNGTWAHSSNGVLPTSAYAQTFLTPATHLTNNDSHLSFYSRTNNNNDGFEFGAVDGGNTNQMAIRFASTGGTFLCDTYGAGGNRINTSNPDSLGFYIDTRTGSTTHKAFKNGVQLGATDSSVSSGLSAITVSYSLGAQSSAGSYSSRQCAFASIGAGLTDADAANLYTAVQAYQTALGRQV